MSAIRTQGLKKHFGRVRALDGLNVSVPEGTVYGFLGPNGAGKTTTIRLLTGLSKPTAGVAQVAGVDTRQRRSLARRIGYLPEEPAFYGWMTPEELLEYVGRVFGIKAAERRRRTQQLLAQVGLEEVRRRHVAGFSRGMRQRLGLAQALYNRPEVLFLDEPVSALDPLGRKEILELIGGLHGQCTVFMSTHILADVERVCDAIGIIDHGLMHIEARRDELIRKYTIPAFELEVEAGTGQALEEWGRKLEKQRWVTKVRPLNGGLRIIVTDMPLAQHELVKLLAASSLPVRRLEVVTPSLEDIFLRVVKARGGAR
jgi:ABC-2 type transport system ATP-binding protein